MKEYLAWSSDLYTITFYDSSDEVFCDQHTVILEMACLDGERVTFCVQEVCGRVWYRSTRCLPSDDHAIALGILEKHSGKILELLRL